VWEIWTHKSVPHVVRTAYTLVRHSPFKRRSSCRGCYDLLSSGVGGIVEMVFAIRCVAPGGFVQVRSPARNSCPLTSRFPGTPKVCIPRLYLVLPPRSMYLPFYAKSRLVAPEVPNTELRSVLFSALPSNRPLYLRPRQYILALSFCIVSELHCLWLMSLAAQSPIHLVPAFSLLHSGHQSVFRSGVCQEYVSSGLHISALTWQDEPSGCSLQSNTKVFPAVVLSLTVW